MAELKYSESINYNGQVYVGNMAAVNLSASIITDKPEDMNYNSVIVNQSLYAGNRNDVKAKITEFEDMIYAKQKELLGE